MTPFRFLEFLFYKLNSQTKPTYKAQSPPHNLSICFLFVHPQVMVATGLRSFPLCSAAAG